MISCYLLSGNFDKLKLFSFCLANYSQRVLDLGEGKQTEGVFKLGVVRTFSNSKDLWEGLWERGKENHGSREPLFLSLNSICQPWTQGFFNY